jgi:simple sugar transport system permease protein
VTTTKLKWPTFWRSGKFNILEDIMVYGGGILVALLLNAVFIALVGGNVLDAYATIIHSSLGSSIGIAQTLNKWVPLLLGGLAVGVGFRAGVTNIGVDGQLYFGAIAATGAGFMLASSNLSPVVAIPIVLAAGIIGGAFYAAIPATLKALFGVNEIFVTVMLNSIALFAVEYITTGPWNDPSAGEAITLPIPKFANLPDLVARGGGHIGILIAFAVVLLVAWMLNRTILGYEIKAVGDNPIAASVGGIKCRWVGFVALIMAGMMAGLGGGIEVAGVHSRLIYGLSTNYGTMAILIAAMGKSNPFGILLASALFAVLFVGSDSLQRSVGLPASAVLVFQAVMFLSILAFRAIREMRGK